MNDLERELMAVLDEDARKAPTVPPTPPNLTRRIHRRQLGTVLVVGLTVLVLIGVSYAGLRSLTRTPAPANSPPSVIPAFHHNGAIIVMTQSGLSSINAATGAEHHLVDCPDPCPWIQHPVWSPDGTQFAYEVDAHSRGASPADLGIWVLDPSTGTSRQLTRSPPPWQCTIPLGDGYISWTGNGSMIAFEECGGIYTVNADGTHKTRVTTFGSDPTFSPDGGQIAFVGSVYHRYGLYLVDVGGSHLHRLTSAGQREFGDLLSDPAWSPDGLKIAFVTAGYPFRISKINVNGSHPADSLFVANGCCVSIGWGGPTWSPDGTRLAFVVGSSLHVIAANGSRSRSLSLPGLAWPDRPAWRPIP